MNEEENDKHEFNFFLDKQIQQRLFDADEEAFAKESQNVLNLSRKPKNNHGANSSSNNNPAIKINSGSNGLRSSFKDSQNVCLCGWISEPGKVYRKGDNEPAAKSKSNSLLASNRELLSSRGDSKYRSGLFQDFVFKHYTDTRKYIEQYRKVHACFDSSNSSATKSDFLDKNRFYAYNQYSALPVNITAQNSAAPSNGSGHQNNTQQTYQAEYFPQYSDTSKTQYNPINPYTNKRESHKQTLVANLRQNHQYKTEKSRLQKQDSDKTILSHSDSPEGLERKRSGSAKERINSSVNGISVHAHNSMGAKVNVPSSSGFSGGRLHKSAIPRYVSIVLIFLI